MIGETLGMIRDNMWFQLVLFLIFALTGLFYIVRGVRKGDNKKLVVGILLLTFGWTKAVFFLKRWDLDPVFKTAINVSEIVIPLTGIIIAAIYIKKWRSYILGLGLLLVVVIGVTYLSLAMT